MGGCNAVPDDFGSYRQWFADRSNGFVKDKTIDGLHFAVQFRPLDLMMLSELEEGKRYTVDELQSIRQEYAGSRYFMLEIGMDEQDGSDPLKRNHADYDTYKQRLSTLSFGMEQRAKLVVAGDTLFPILAHMEQGYELGHRQRILIAFPAQTNHADAMTFIFEDDVFHTYQQKFTFRIDDKQIPKIPVQIINV